ncbi:efflux RND transporter periplasmic adaptor subunit [Shewanella marina]|uniref:efflux RND transporter periplasmic adaptor subunit n=1 Tax=Shewanella marina TaxID=487319 RepID=UPI000563383F|nr:efflux RND transporter periplasmic adaptor subunit [Shewanella marina]
MTLFRPLMIRILPFSVLLLAACDSSTATITTAAPTPVITQTLQQQSSYQQQHQYTGLIEAVNTTTIGFELAGKLDNIAVDSGDTVKQGQLLAQLDDQLLQAELKQLQANLAQNQADLNVAQAALKRNRQLQQDNYVSAQQLDETIGQQASLIAAQAQIIAAMSATQLKIDKSNLVAPFDGSISQRFHQVGEVISQSNPIFTLVGQGQSQAHIGVPINLAKTLIIGSKVEIKVDEQSYQAVIAGNSGQVTPQTRTVDIRVLLPPHAQVFNGELAQLQYQQELAEQGFWIPLSALTDGRRGRWNVYVVNQQQQPNTLERRDVNILVNADNQAYVTGALYDNEQIVTQGLHKLVAGQYVSLSKANAQVTNNE